MTAALHASLANHKVLAITFMPTQSGLTNVKDSLALHCIRKVLNIITLFVRSRWFQL